MEKKCFHFWMCKLSDRLFIMDLPKRGRPKRTATSKVYNPLPQIEDYKPSIMEEQMNVRNFRQEDKIIIGFKPKGPNQKRIINLGFTNKIQDKKNLLNKYQNDLQTFQQNVTDILGDSNINDYPANLIYSTVSVVANDNQLPCNQFHEFITVKLQEMAEVIPKDMKNFSDTSEIGEYWENVTRKISLICISWDPLCQKEKNLGDFKTIFNESLANVFESQYQDLFAKLSQMIIISYNEARESKDISSVKSAFAFLAHFRKGLFENIFLPLLIESIKEYYTPILDRESQISSIADYLKTSVELKNQEESLLRELGSEHVLKRVENELNLLIFGLPERFDSICKNLAPFIQENDHEIIKICADYARSIDKIIRFAQELSYEFEAEAEKCFKMENPIKAIMKLYRTLSDFEDCFNVNHRRMLRSAFEKGFNTSPDSAAKLLAQEVHREFLQKENDHKACPKETIDQLVAIFRMLASKDVFEVAHHMLLSRRILMMKKHVNEADEEFREDLRKQCGPDYTKSIDVLFSDVDTSLEIFKEFQNSYQSPPSFKAIVLASQCWKFNADETHILPPEPIRYWMDTFSNFYKQSRKSNEKKKIEWDFQHSRVKLTVNNFGSLKTITCNAVYATFFLLFNNQRVLTSDYFTSIGHFSQEQIETIQKVLKSKKCKRMLLILHNKMRLNSEQFNDDHSSTTEKKPSCFDYNTGILSLPIVFPSLPASDKNSEKMAALSTDQWRQSQIDAAVMRVMKMHRSMEKNELKDKVKEKLTFRMDDELFEKRLAQLSKLLYLKLDQSGRVHYLP